MLDLQTIEVQKTFTKINWLMLFIHLFYKLANVGLSTNKNLVNNNCWENLILQNHGKLPQPYKLFYTY